MSRDVVMAFRRGEMRPPGEDGRVDETEKLRTEVVALRGDLAAARAQRDGVQKALDEANRDNDVLRAELARVKQAHEDEIAEYTAAALGNGAAERE